MTKKQRILEVTIMFETTRMKDSYLTEAYEILVPSAKKEPGNSGENIFTSEKACPVTNMEI